MTKICSEQNFEQLADAISRLETYVGLRNDVDLNTVSGRLKDFSNFVTSELVEQYKVVSLDENGYIKKASSNVIEDSEKIVGISVEQKDNNNPILIQNFGKLQNPSWNWDLNLPLMLGINGEITQTPPTEGFWIKIGQVVSNDEILVNISIPILMNEVV